MRLDEKAIRVHSSTETGNWLFTVLLSLGISFASTGQASGGQHQTDISPGISPLTTGQVVERLVGMNLRRAQALHSYHSTRTYRAEYRGFLSTTNAEMAVDVDYRAPGTKQFTVRSSTGSKLIRDKVFKKLLEAEEDALSADAQQSAAINGENYDFKMVGYESTALRSMYVLVVEPRTKSRFLFRGRVWVDANDFAVVRLEAEPVRNPSFWTKNSKIEQTYQKVGNFWLPQRNHSISSIRIGGRAELNIEYQSYEITASDPVESVAALEGSRSADSSLAKIPNGH